MIVGAEVIVVGQDGLGVCGHEVVGQDLIVMIVQNISAAKAIHGGVLVGVDQPMMGGSHGIIGVHTAKGGEKLAEYGLSFGTHGLRRHAEGGMKGKYGRGVAAQQTERVKVRNGN